MNEYSFIAPVYDILLFPFLWNIRHRVLKIVTEVKPERIIDLCCGTGSQLRLLKRNGFHVVGIDLSESMLKVAKRGVNAPDCFLRDATATNFESEAFDFAMITFSLHETGWKNAHAILDEVQRILKPGGHVMIVDYALGKGAPKMVDRVIGWIEFLAGKSHHGNFIHYKQSGGLDVLLENKSLSPVFTIYKGYRSIVLKVLKKD
ncbi:MAG: class I SAM-dependent methyltransferase [Deltaproteobacteria bacterium]|nr:class I SAM-dependent methyltransferase [Deltaproteobacteria bacterium]